MKYMNLVIGRESNPARLHMILDNDRLCQREDPLPTEFVHYPNVPKNGSPFCGECKSRLDTIISNNPNYKGV